MEQLQRWQRAGPSRFFLFLYLCLLLPNHPLLRCMQDVEDKGLGSCTSVWCRFMTDLCRAFFSCSFFLIITTKKDDASSALDFRPVSLMHNIMNIFGKLLASRLAPELHSLVSAGWSAFIRRSIHDNFLFVKSVLKEVTPRRNLCFGKARLCHGFRLGPLGLSYRSSQWFWF